jgi:hypothetical protein
MRGLRADRSTLFTSPASFGDFAFRLAFFSVAPFAIVRAAELFPMTGVLVDVALALGVFIAGEAVRRYASKHRLANALLSRALRFETYYRERPPRPFVYYVLYPLLFPYWLVQRDARREFWMFRGYTLGGLAVLLVVLAWQYFRWWPPELGLRDFLPTVVVTLAVETVLVLALLMPIATTVVWYHSSFRRGRLAVVLVAALLATGYVLVRTLHRRQPVVSYATRTRVILRTVARPKLAHAALLAAARVAWPESAHAHHGDRAGLIGGAALEAAEATLERFYRRDEAYAFELWGSTRDEPSLLVIFFRASRRSAPIWVAVSAGRSEVSAPSALPAAALRAMHWTSERGGPPPPPWSGVY